MKHLSDEALVDLAEGGVRGLDHLDTCAVCRKRVEMMRETMRLLREDRIPEPSPLFWQHFSQRVGRAIDEDSASTAHRRMIPRWTWGLAAIMGIIVIALIVPMQRTPQPVPIADGGASTASPHVAVRIPESRPSTGSGGPEPAEGRIPNPESRSDNGSANDVSWAVADTDGSWQIVAGLADDLDLEAASDAGIFVRPGAIERELLILSDSERADLARVIQAELDRSLS